jgi:hypothetical protein
MAQDAHPAVPQDTPAAQGPPPVEAQGTAPPPPSSSADVHLEAVPAGSAYFVRSAGAPDADYRMICTAPCETALPTGPVQVAVLVPSVGVVDVQDPVEVPGNATIRATYTRNLGRRIAGWIVLGAGTSFGAGVLTWGLLQRERSCDVTCGTSPNMGSVVVGAASIVVGLAVGLPLALRRDQLKVEIIPDAGARLMLPARIGVERSLPPSDAQGMALRVSF